MRSLIPTLICIEALPSHLNLTCLCKLDMAVPQILQIKKITQNVLLYTTTHKEIHWLFGIAQTIGMEMLEWISGGEKILYCEGLHGWNWLVSKGVNSDFFPLLEDQFLILDMALEPSNSSVLILHLHF